MFYSILGKEKCEDSGKISIFTDFNLNVCISYMNNLVKGYDLQKLYENIPKESETTKYRRKITSDMQNEAVFKAFDRYAKQVARAVTYEKKSTYSNLIYQKQKWHLDSLLIYIQAVEQLLDDLKRQSSYSDAMEEFVSYLCEVTKSEAFVKGKELAQNLHQSMEETKMIFSLQKNKVVWEEKSEGDFFAERMAKAFAVDKKPGQAVNVNKETELTMLEKNLAERQIKRQNWDGMLETLLQIPMDEKLVQLAEDVQYYLGFFLLVRDMKGRGYSFCMPEETDKLEVKQGYDLALALRSEKEVIANDCNLQKDERFFVITGANGGGKTTYARMIGQILYFAKMGLLVPCEKAGVPNYTTILSHFSNDESEMSGKGKLVEELTRLKPMMQEKWSGSFVILNELFTTAATWDAGIMGQKVLDYFMSHDCYGIYVTHIQSLAKERDGLVSLVAELADDHHTRSFKITRKPASEAEYEDSLITKYNMTENQMKAVIGHED